MAESLVQVTEGTGKKLHTNSYTVGANTVEDEFVVPGPFPYASYVAVYESVSIATANDHLACLNAGASLKVRVVRIRLEQTANVTTAATSRIQLLRTTTGAPTGGTAITPAPFDTADAASGAAARSIPGVKGTESTMLNSFAMVWRQAVSATAAQVDDAWEWTALTWQKAIVIPTGTTNGLVLKNVTANAAGQVNITIEFVETAF